MFPILLIKVILRQNTVAFDARLLFYCIYHGNIVPWSFCSNCRYVYGIIISRRSGWKPWWRIRCPRIRSTCGCRSTIWKLQKLRWLEKWDIYARHYVILTWSWNLPRWSRYPRMCWSWTFCCIMMMIRWRFWIRNTATITWTWFSFDSLMMFVIFVPLILSIFGIVRIT